MQATAAHPAVMRFIDYVKGERLALASDLSPGEVADRLSADIKWIGLPFVTGVTGWVAFGRFALRYRRRAWMRQDWHPVLAGRIFADGSGSSIALHYRAPRLLAVLALLLPLIFVYLMLEAITTFGGSMVGTFVPFGAIYLLLLVVGIGSALMEAKDDLAEMLTVIEAAAGRSG